MLVNKNQVDNAFAMPDATSSPVSNINNNADLPESATHKDQFTPSDSINARRPQKVGAWHSLLNTASYYGFKIHIGSAKILNSFNGMGTKLWPGSLPEHIELKHVIEAASFGHKTGALELASDIAPGIRIAIAGYNVHLASPKIKNKTACIEAASIGSSLTTGAIGFVSGKIIGATAGVFMAGPAGALVGGVCGSVILSFFSGLLGSKVGTKAAEHCYNHYSPQNRKATDQPSSPL